MVKTILETILKIFPILCDPPYELLLRENAVIAGPHQGGKVVMILSEQISCDYYWIAKCAAWKGGQHKRHIAEIALASQKGTKPMIVEYLSSAVGRGGEAICQTQFCTAAT